MHMIDGPHHSHAVLLSCAPSPGPMPHSTDHVKGLLWGAVRVDLGRDAEEGLEPVSEAEPDARVAVRTLQVDLHGI